MQTENKRNNTHTVKSPLQKTGFPAKCFFLNLGAFTILLLTACSPLPTIQSPHIHSQFAIGSSIKTSGNFDGNIADEAVKSQKKFVVDETVPFFLSLGFANRVEISGMGFPYLVYGMMWQGNVKVALFDIGEGNFQNLAAAIFIGSSGYNGEHDKILNYYGGISASTTARLGVHEFEFIAQSSLAKEKYTWFDGQNDQHTIYWLQPALGIIYTPGTQRIVEFNLGLNYSIPVKSDVYWNSYDMNSQLTTTSYTNKASGGLAFIGELRFNIVR
jgi:hypothetical protein